MNDLRPQLPSGPGTSKRGASLDLSRSDWVGVSAGVLAFVASFLPWYTVEFEGAYAMYGSNYSASGWDVGFGGWFPILLLILAAAAIGVRAAGVKYPEPAAAALPFLQLGVPVLAVLVILLRWLTYPGGSDQLGSAGAGFGLFVGLLAALLGCAGGWMAFRDAE